jgi:hypothetical protein
VAAFWPRRSSEPTTPFIFVTGLKRTIEWATLRKPGSTSGLTEPDERFRPDAAVRHHGSRAAPDYCSP